jgi:hypothetical protein
MLYTIIGARCLYPNCQRAMGMLPHSNFRFWISDFGLDNQEPIQNPNSKIQNKVVEVNGLEPMASCVQSRRSPS